ncbi:MAG: STAS domain-containing protein [Solirubrobacteraceae bacterium]
MLLCRRRRTRPTTEDLSSVHKRVIISLERLTFTDSSGMRLLVNAFIDARRDGWDLEIGQELAPQIRKVIDLTGALLRRAAPNRADGQAPHCPTQHGR